MLCSLLIYLKTDFVLRCGTALEPSLIISDYSRGAHAKSKALELPPLFFFFFKKTSTFLI